MARQTRILPLVVLILLFSASGAAWLLWPEQPIRYQIRSVVLPSDGEVWYRVYESCSPLNMAWCLVGGTAVRTIAEAEERLARIKATPGEKVVRTVD